MVLSTWISVLLFLVFVAPGLLFDLLAARRRVGVAESSFKEASRIALSSLLFSGMGVLAIALLRVLFSEKIPDIDRLLLDPEYLAENFWKSVILVAFGLAVAMIGAVGAHLILAYKDGASLRSVSNWTKVFRDECPSGLVPHARVRLLNDLVYVGRVGHYNASLERGDRELTLVPPLYFKDAKRGLQPMPKDWQRIIVPGGEIVSIAVKYQKPPKGDPSLEGGNSPRLISSWPGTVPLRNWRG